jgi:hypothetical protein
MDSCHLTHQEYDATVNSYLRDPVPVPDWHFWPTLESFAKSLLALGTHKGYLFYRGKHGFGLQDAENPSLRSEIPPFEKNHCVPEAGTLSSRNPPVSYESKCHLHKVFMITHILCSTAGSVKFTAPRCVRVLVAVHYDSQLLSQGAFINVRRDHQIFVDGVTPCIDLETVRRVGPRGLHKYVEEHCQYETSVAQFIACDLASILAIPFGVQYVPALGVDSTYVEALLIRMIKGIETCCRCIIKGLADSCKFGEDPLLPCSNCQDVPDCECWAALVKHTSGDMAPTQVVHSQETFFRIFYIVHNFLPRFT